MKSIFLSLFLTLPFLAPVASPAAPVVEDPAPITAILVGPAFQEGGGKIGDIGVMLSADSWGFARDLTADRPDQDVRWITYSRHGQEVDLDGADYLAIFAYGWTFTGKIHGGPDGRRFVFGKWWCNSSGSRGHILFEVTYLGC